MHESWCVKNGILIYAEAIVGTKLVRICVQKGNDKPIVGTKEYKQGKQLKPTDEKWWIVVEQLRENYYNKNNK